MSRIREHARKIVLEQQRLKTKMYIQTTNDSKFCQTYLSLTIGSSVEVAIERWRPLLSMDTLIRSLLLHEMVPHRGVVSLQCRKMLVPCMRIIWSQQNRCVYYSGHVIEPTSIEGHDFHTNQSSSSNYLNISQEHC